jgi:hypothetical protein
MSKNGMPGPFMPRIILYKSQSNEEQDSRPYSGVLHFALWGACLTFVWGAFKTLLDLGALEEGHDEGT